MNGSIYWDESSRGYNCGNVHSEKKRGRWVGERLENGKRVRFRSTDYDKVVAWMQRDQPCDHIKPLKGMPYKVNLQRCTVIGKGDREIYGREENGRKRYRLCADGQRMDFYFERLAYAALHNIDVRKIPKDITVRRTDDGEYVLEYKSEALSRASRKGVAARRGMILASLDRRQQEIELLKHYYKTGDSANIISYASAQLDPLARYVRRNFNICQQRSIDIAIETIEDFCQRVTDGTTLVESSITYSLRHRARLIRDKRMKMKEYKDNKYLSEL
jgi:hypothetical protein